MTDSTPPEEESVFAEGRVIRSTGSWMHVETADHDIVPARVRGKFRLEDRDVTNPVAVGDIVTVRMESDGTGLIVELHDRKNKLSRRAYQPCILLQRAKVRLRWLCDVLCVFSH